MADALRDLFKQNVTKLIEISDTAAPIPFYRWVNNKAYPFGDAELPENLEWNIEVDSTRWNALEGSRVCRPDWMGYSDGIEKECPYGKNYYHVTWPKDGDLVYRFAAFLGFTPYALVGLVVVLPFIGLLVNLSMHRKAYISASYLWFAFTGGIMWVLGEQIVKNKYYSPRPGATALPLFNDFGVRVGTCQQTCGNPSGHSSTSMFCFVMIMFYMISQMLMQKKKTLKHPATVVTAFFLLTFFIATVPLARVANYDHTPRQAMMGSFIGISWAFFCILLGTGLISCHPCGCTKKYGDTLGFPFPGCEKLILCDIVPCNDWTDNMNEFSNNMEESIFDEDEEDESDTFT